MTKLIDEAVEAVKKLPPKTQDDIARFMINLANNIPEPLTPEVRAALAEADAQILRGERVPAEVMQAFWQSHNV